MKTLLRFLVVASLVCTLAGIAEAKVKPKNFGATTSSRLPIAIGPDGVLHIAYQGADYHLYHARFDGKKWLRELVDGASDCGRNNAIAIDSQGHIHIMYGAERHTGTTYTSPLVHAYFNGAAWQVTDLPVSGSEVRMALDVDGHPHVLFKISYSPFTYQYGKYDGANWQFVDTGFSYSPYSEGLVVDADGHAHISYQVNYSGCFYATNKSGQWETTKLTDYNAAGATAIALDKAGNPHVVTAVGGALIYHSYDGSSWTNETMVDFNDADPGIQANIEAQIAMTLDANGHPQVLAPVYLASGNRYVTISVFVFHDGVDWNGLLVDTKNTGFYPSLVLDTNGVDYATYCSESANARTSKAKWVRIALSDLTGAWTGISIAGTTVTGTLNVTNQGLETSAKTTASLWLSDDTTLDGSDTLLPVTLKIKSLAPGSKVAVPVNFQYAGALAGKQLIAVIDPDMATADRNFLDNTIAGSLGP